MVDAVEPQAQPLATYLAAQVEAAREHLGDVPEEHAIHQTRVALRRLRSALRVFADLLTLTEEQRVDADEELGWFAGVLGEVRDRQVQRRRFITVLAQVPPEDVSEETVLRVAIRIETALLDEERRAARLVEETLGTARLLALRDLLDGWHEHPPVADAAERTHRRAVRRAARRAAAKADHRLAAAVAGIDDEQLHRARKAAKRARYAAEVLRPVSSHEGEDQRTHYKGLQEVLGDFQDAVVAQGTIRRLAMSTGDAETGFVLGLLYAQAVSDAAALRHRARALLG